MARQAVRAKHIMEICGWKISSDRMQFIIAKDGLQYYHMTLENALYDISQMEEKSVLQRIQPDLQNIVETLRQSRSEFIESIKGAVVLEIK